MAIDALRAGLAHGVAGVFDGVVILRLQTLAVDAGDRGLARRVVALHAHGVARCLQFVAVRVMAIAAAHALVEHFALQERAVFEHFVLDLAVQLIEFAGQGAGQVIVHQPLADGEAIAQRCAAGMAARAGFDFYRGVPVLEIDVEALMDQIVFFLRPLQVIRRRAMTGLTADSEAVPLTVEAVARCIEIALETGGVAFDAHEIGVLARFAPVQRILEVHALAGVQMKPAIFLGIPRHAEGLQTPLTHLDQILL